MPKNPFGFVEICDAVYKDEKTNKVVIAGLFGGDIYLDMMPMDLRIALFLDVVTPAAGEHSIELQFFVGKQLVGGAEAAMEGPAGAKGGLLFPPFSIPFARPSTLEIKGSWNGGRSRVLMKKLVLVKEAEDPSA